MITVNVKSDTLGSAAKKVFKNIFPNFFFIFAKVISSFRFQNLNKSFECFVSRMSINSKSVCWNVNIYDLQSMATGHRGANGVSVLDLAAMENDNTYALVIILLQRMVVVVVKEIAMKLLNAVRENAQV